MNLWLMQSVWPEKNRQISIKVAQKFFHYKNECFWLIYKNCLTMRAIWGKIIVAVGFVYLPKKQKIAQSGHTECN